MRLLHIASALLVLRISKALFKVAERMLMKYEREMTASPKRGR